MKTSKLIGPALNWAVVKASGQNADYWLEKYASEDRRCMCESPSTDWSQGGSIIEREKIQLLPSITSETWNAACPHHGNCIQVTGPTPLIAAMRCFCASRLGDEVDIPKELLGEQ